MPTADPGETTLTLIVNSYQGENMEQLAGVSRPPGSFGALLWACRHRAFLSQEQLAARAELSERTVRNLEAGRVRSPRADTVRLLAGALRLSGPEREIWFEAARGRPPQAAAQAWAGQRGRDGRTRDGGGLAGAGAGPPSVKFSPRP